MLSVGTLLHPIFEIVLNEEEEHPFPFCIVPLLNVRKDWNFVRRSGLRLEVEHEGQCDSLRQSLSQDHKASDLEVPRTKPDPVQTGCSDGRFGIACGTKFVKSLYQRHGGRPVIPLHVRAISQSMIKKRGAQMVKKWEAMNEVYLARRRELSSFARSEGHSNSVPHTRSTHVRDLKPIVMGEEITKHSFVPYRHVLVALLVEADDSSA